MTANLFWNYERERQYCTDFLCCGLRLNDLYDLLEHYEERHVLVDDIFPHYADASRPSAVQRTAAIGLRTTARAQTRIVHPPVQAKRSHLLAFRSPSASLQYSDASFSDNESDYRNCQTDDVAAAFSNVHIVKRRCLADLSGMSSRPPSSLNHQRSMSDDIDQENDETILPSPLLLLSMQSTLSDHTVAKNTSDRTCLLSLISEQDVARNLDYLDAAIVVIDPAYLCHRNCASSSVSSYSDASVYDDKTSDDEDDNGENTTHLHPSTSTNLKCNNMKPLLNTRLTSTRVNSHNNKLPVSTVFSDHSKRMRCPVDGCIKSYKNNNGLKYHLHHYHQDRLLVTSTPSELVNNNHSLFTAV